MKKDRIPIILFWKSALRADQKKVGLKYLTGCNRQILPAFGDSGLSSVAIIKFDNK